MEKPSSEKLGKYKILKKIGQGGMAEVFHARQIKLDRDVAIKVLHDFLLETDKNFLPRFQREARSIAALRHPNIVQAYDFDNVGERYFLVMEYIDGPSLKTVLKSMHNAGRRLPLSEVLRITYETGIALDYAHGREMIHRDVKPANVLLEKTGRVVLTDFGIAKLLSGTQYTATGTMMGTPAYMAPEQAQEEEIDARVDIYSLGVILYEMATGSLPYEAETPIGVMLKHINTPLTPPSVKIPDLPPALEKTITKSLAKNPDERYQNIPEMLADLAPLQRQYPSKYDNRTISPETSPPVNEDALAETISQFDPSIETVPAVPQAQRSPRRFPWKWVGVGIAALILMVLGVVAVQNLLSKPEQADFMEPEPPIHEQFILFEDDFSNHMSGWDSDRDETGITDYEDDVYRIFVDIPHVNFFSNPKRHFHHIRIELDVQKISGPDQNTFGVLCGYQDPENFYFLLISSDQLFGIGKTEFGVPSYIGMDRMGRSDVINPGNAHNHLQAICTGDMLALIVNGELIAEVRDPGADIMGDIGLIASTEDFPGTDILFDNLIVFEP